MNKKSMKNITRLDDYRQLDFKIRKINMKFDIGVDETYVTTELHIKYNKQKQIFFNGQNLNLLQIRLNKKALKVQKDYVVTDDGLFLLNAPKEFWLKTKVSIRPKDNKDLQGLYVSGDVLCSKCETEGFRRITYFPDRPDALSRFTVTIDADREKFPILLSNGNLKSKKTLANGKHRVVWDDPFKKPCYLFAIIAGDFAHIEDVYQTKSRKKVRLGVYVEKGKEADAMFAMQSLKRAMLWDEEYYGRKFDLKQMNIVAIKDFNSGACENKGLNIFNDKYILANPENATVADYRNVDLIVAHEYFHNWSGNKVTIENWFNLALKEGLTVYRTQKYAHSFYDKDSEVINEAMDIINHQFSYDASPMAHPIIPKEYFNVRSIYNSTTYEKAAKVFDMLEALLGSDRLNKGLQSYFDKFNGMAVGYQDLIKEVEKSAKVDLNNFSLWFDITGTVQAKLTDTYNSDTKTYRLSISHNKDRDLVIPMKISLLYQNKEEVHDIVIDNSYKTFTFNGVSSHPIVSLNCDFSAPIDIVQHQSDEDLKQIIKTSSFAFARYRAMQKYMLGAIQDEKSDIAELFSAVLLDDLLSDDVKTKILMAPSSSAISDTGTERDFDLAFSKRQSFCKMVAQSLNSELQNVYTSSQNKELRCLILGYLSHLQEHKDMVIDCYYNSPEMTEKFNAFFLIVMNDWQERTQVIDDFYNTYQSNHLVINKWFAALASSVQSDTMERVKGLLNHKDFSFANPNNVFALLGSFGRNNLFFHKADGSGYEFFADCVLKVDKHNPQIANLLMDFFGMYSDIGQARQNLIKQTLKSMRAGSSSILQDKIDKLCA